MQRRISTLCLLLILLMSTTAFAVDFKTKPKLAFYPLVAKSVDAIAFTESISTQLFNSIERTDFFEILERKKVESVLVQAGATLASMSQDSLYTVANRAGFDIFIVGNVSRVEGASLIDLQVVGSGSRNSYYAETFRVPEYEIPKKLQEMTEKIVAKVKGFNIAPAPVEKKVGCPANLTISGTPKSIKLKWTPPQSSQVIGYAIMRSNSANGSFVQLATTTTPSYTDENLKLNETFYYKVKAISKSGIECELSDAIIGRTSPAPLPPIFIDIKSELAGAQLNWYSRPYSGNDRNLTTSGFQIYRKAPDETEYRLIAKVGREAVSYLDNDMKNGVVYGYALTSFNPEKVESEFSSILEARNAPAASNIRAASGGKRAVQLTWIPNESKSVAGYSIYRSTLADENFERIVQVKGRGADSYLDSGLEDGSTYWYRIAANIDGKGETPKSEPVSAKTRQRPSPPAGLVASNDEPRRVVLNWQSAGTPEDAIKGYYLYRAGEKDGEFVKLAEIPYKKNSYIDDKEKGSAEKSGMSKFSSLVSDGSRPLSDGKTYYYRISCFNEAGSESLPSETVSSTTRSTLAPPKHLRASTSQAGRVTLNWDSTPEFKVYEVYRGATGQNEVLKIKSVKEPFFVDSSVAHGASYIYAVKGIDALEIPSIISTSVIGSTKPRPAVPKGVAVTDLDGRRGISWEPNPEKDVLRYNVYKKNFVGMFQKASTVFGTFFALDGVKGKQELRVSAEDNDGLESEKTDVLMVEVK